LRGDQVEPPRRCHPHPMPFPYLAMDQGLHGKWSIVSTSTSPRTAAVLARLVRGPTSSPGLPRRRRAERHARDADDLHSLNPVSRIRELTRLRDWSAVRRKPPSRRRWGRRRPRWCGDICVRRQPPRPAPTQPSEGEAHGGGGGGGGGRAASPPSDWPGNATGFAASGWHRAACSGSRSSFRHGGVQRVVDIDGCDGGRLLWPTVSITTAPVRQHVDSELLRDAAWHALPHRRRLVDGGGIWLRRARCAVGGHTGSTSTRPLSRCVEQFFASLRARARARLRGRVITAVEVPTRPPTRYVTLCAVRAEHGWSRPRSTRPRRVPSRHGVHHLPRDAFWLAPLRRSVSQRHHRRPSSPAGHVEVHLFPLRDPDANATTILHADGAASLRTDTLRALTMPRSSCSPTKGLEHTKPPSTILS